MSNFAQEERSLAGTNIIWSLAVELSCGFGTNWKFVHWGACLPAVQAPVFSAATTSMPKKYERDDGCLKGALESAIQFNNDFTFNECIGKDC